MPYGVNPPSLVSWLNPLAAINNVMQIIVYSFAMALFYLQELVNLLFVTLAGVINSAVTGMVALATPLGPFALPVFAILLVAFLSIMLIMGMVLRDVPIVGAFT